MKQLLFESSLVSLVLVGTAAIPFVVAAFIGMTTGSDLAAVVGGGLSIIPPLVCFEWFLRRE